MTWSADQDFYVRDMAARGFSHSVIGRRIGKSKDAVRHRLKSLALAHREIDTDIEIPISWDEASEKASESSAPKLQRVLFVPDVHRPYHSEAAWQLMLRAARLFKPHRLVVLGDFADFYAVSAHEKNPNRKHNLEYEVGDSNKGLDDLDTLGADEKDFIKGNHEYRLEAFLASNAAPLFNMMSVEKLLKLEERGWNVTQYGEALQIGKLWVTHDEGNAGPYAAMRARATFEGNVVIGHTHRASVSYQGNAKGEAHVGAMFGWLGDIEHVDYMHRVRAQQWVHGFGIGYLLPNGEVHLQAVPIVNGRCVIEGQLVE